MKYHTVLFCGQLAAAKDTAADYLCGRLNLRDDCVHWVRNGFAYAVKKIFMDTFSVSWEFIEKWKRISEPPPGFDKNIRDSLIFIGDGFRKIQPNIWIDLAFRNQQYNQAIGDGRYVNETNYIRDRGGLSILMWRPGHENSLLNASEQELMPFVNELKSRKPIPEGVLKDKDIPFDIFLVNDGSLGDLYVKIDEIVIPEVVKMVHK